MSVRRAVALVIALAFAAPTAASPTDAAVRPNVLIVITDDQAIDSMDAMPKTLEWMGGGGTHYPNAYVATPLCCPSRASLMSGRYPQNHRVRRIEDWRRFDHSKTIQRELRDAGYRTGFIGKMFVAWPLRRRPPGFERFSVGWGYFNARYNVDGDVRHVPYGPTFDFDQAGRYVKGWEGRDDDPWYLYVSPRAPHTPRAAKKQDRRDTFGWKGTPATHERRRGDKPPWVRRSDVSHAKGKAIRTSQLRTLQAVDRGFDGLMTGLAALSELDNTIVIFTSDNGFLWGDHGLKEKHAPYDRAVRVPFYIRGPGIVPGGVDQRLTINTDVAPTIFARTGVVPSYVVDGKDLLGPPAHNKLLLQFKAGNNPDRKDWLPPTWASLVTPTYQYTRYYGKRRIEEYYDLVADPYQLRNLVASGFDVPDALTDELTVARKCVGVACP